jgi:hypothetical protein
MPAEIRSGKSLRNIRKNLFFTPVRFGELDINRHF